jgi:hypothetical protein
MSLVDCIGRKADTGHPRPLVRPSWPLNGRRGAASTPHPSQASADGGSTEEEFSNSSSVVSLLTWGVRKSATIEEHMM